MTRHSEATLNGYADTELIELILKGEKHYFEHIIRRYNQRLFRIGIAVLGDDTEVEDAMQTAYINAYLHLEKFEHRSSFSTWITKIMLNQCFEQKRKKQLIKSKLGEPGNDVYLMTPAKELVNKELNRVLETAIANLPEKYRLVFVMREMEDMSVRETSALLNIEEPNVKVRLNRAKTLLRKNLDGYVKDQVYSFHLNRCDRIVMHVMQYLGIPVG